MLKKARSRPDLVKKVLAKARDEGPRSAMDAVKGRLAEEIPLGYSGAGDVVAVGEAVSGIAIGDRVATGGASKATHSEWQAVPGLLCSRLPTEVSYADGAFATIGAIAMHGFRISECSLGSNVVVVGLGLIGQLVMRLAAAAGCQVIGLDLLEGPVMRIQDAGGEALVDKGEETSRAIWSRFEGAGADAVIVTAATSSSEPVMRSTSLLRDRGAIVVVGDVGLDIDRRPFYEQELELRFARSYGPGRYEASYESWGVDLPGGFVRWTEGRNQAAVLDLVASGRLRVNDLITHRFHIEEAVDAYGVLDSREDSAAILLQYGVEEPARDVSLGGNRPPSTSRGRRIGLVGAGSFARSTLLPALTGAGFIPSVIASNSGVSARRLGEATGFAHAVSGGQDVITHEDVDVVVIASDHASHAGYVVEALRAGKHVFCEKPLAVTIDELDVIEAAWEESRTVLFTGFNRRWSPLVAQARSTFAQPVVIDYRVNAGTLPEGHWYSDRRQGGRLIGEGCHFVDTCIVLCGDSPSGVKAFGTGSGETLLAEDFVISLRFPNGSLASITYTSAGHPSGGKERVEIMGGGRTLLIDDFRSITVDGKSSKGSGQDKGHTAQAQAFSGAISEGDSTLAPLFFSSMRATLRAASTLTGMA
jgi:predicted dehydrogenase/threonine dehydrogenase-like Zn-dependent dehydrogenase